MGPRFLIRTRTLQSLRTSRPYIEFFSSLVNRRGNDGRGNDAGSDGCKDIVAIDRPPLVAAWWRTQVIVPIVNRLSPVPVFLFHVVALLPFIMANVVVVMIVVMILGKRYRADEARA
jgi:hypothetical protein